MNFRTELKVAKSEEINLTHKQQIFCLGSCFATHIGQKLLQHKFQVKHIKGNATPLGTTFNPVSMARQMRWLADAEELSEQHFVEVEGNYRHLDFHSDFQAGNQDQLWGVLEQTKKKLSSWFKKPDVLILTFGSAWVYEWQQTEEVIANCHKVPQQYFEKRLLDVHEVVESVASLFAFLSPKTQVILTVSPVRHLKDTLQLNAVSKSILRLACHQLSGMHPQISYFPAYELVLDDLRDYRFFKSDMLHPSEQAVDYVWEKFGIRYFQEDTQAFINTWGNIDRRLNHRAVNPKSTAHQKFVKKLLDDLQQIQGVNVKREIQQVKKQLVTA